MEKIEKKYQFIFPFFPQAKWTQYENFKVKITIDIKMAILWQCKNHHNRTKYSIVSLQECFRILQFKSGHPVSSDSIIYLIRNVMTYLDSNNLKYIKA